MRNKDIHLKLSALKIYIRQIADSDYILKYVKNNVHMGKVFLKKISINFALFASL